MTRKTLMLWVRVVCGLGLLALLIAWIGPGTLQSSLDTFLWPYYVLAVMLLCTHFLFQSLVLKILLGRKGLAVRARHLFRLTLISQFFGVFLPGAMGPDLILCYNAARSAPRKEDVLSAIAFIRIITLFVMTLFAFAASFHPVAAQPAYQWLTGVVLCAFFGAFLFMSNRRILDWLQQTFDFLNRYRITALAYKTYFALAAYGRDTQTHLRIAPWILGSALIKILTDYTIALTLGFDASPLYFFVAVPLVTVASAIPLTFAGLGLREGAFVGLLTQVGIPAEQALAISLVSFTLIFVIAVIGAILYLFYGTKLATRDDA